MDINTIIFGAAAIIPIIAFFVFILHSPSARIKEGRGKGEYAMEYIRKHIKEVEGYKTLPVSDMKKPTISLYEVYWENSETSVFEADSVRIMQLHMMRLNEDPKLKEKSKK